MFFLSINGLIKYLKLKLNRGSFVSTVLALIFADDISSFSDNVMGHND